MTVIIALALALLAGLGAGGGIIWSLTQNRVDKCNATWQAKLSTAEAEIAKANNQKREEINTAENLAKEKVTNVELRLKGLQERLAVAETNIPLSKACDECRVPESRVWGLRDSARAAAINPKPTLQPATKDQPGPATSRKKRTVPKPQAGSRVQRSRTLEGARVRAIPEKTD